MSTIQEFFAGKTVLVTGATGFLGKAVVEKMLRSLPDVRQLYLLIRPKERGSRPVPADQRFREEVLKSSIFDPLRRELGDRFDDCVNSRIGEIVRPLPFDAEAEVADLERACEQLKQRYAGEPTVLKEKLVALGLESARARGWHDTYTFTKALGEQLLARHRGDVPTAIVR